MRKTLAVLVALLFLVPAVALAKDNKRDKKHSRTHKQEQVQQQQPRHGTQFGQRDNDRERRMERDRRVDSGHMRGRDDYDSHNRWRTEGHSRYHTGRYYVHDRRSYKYKGHVSRRDWERDYRHRYPNVRQYRDVYGQLMFSFCDGPGCFSFSIGN